MSELIAVQGLTLAPQGIVSGGVLVITSVPSIKVKANGNGVYSGSLSFTLVGADATGYDPGTVATVGVASISASGAKVKDGGSLVMRENDQSLTIAMTGTVSGTPTPFTEAWKITAAGQTKVKAE